MKLSNRIYFCEHCRKIKKTIDELLFVEDAIARGFCSDPCIEKFFEPHVTYYENFEKELRKSVNLEKEDVSDIVGKPAYMDQVLRRPDEVWKDVNDLGEELYCFVKHFEDKQWGEFSMAVLCLVFDKRPSFIIAATASRHISLINKFKIGVALSDFELSSDDNSKQTVTVDEQTLIDVEQKKGSMLAQMLSERSPADIPFESFHLYDEYFDQTLSGPDEIYSSIDEAGDRILTYIKAFERDGVSFYYFVINFPYKTASVDESMEALIPIISFPSVDGEVYRHFKKGNLISGSLKS